MAYFCRKRKYTRSFPHMEIYLFLWISGYIPIRFWKVSAFEPCQNLDSNRRHLKKFWSTVGNRASSSEAVGRSSFPKHSLIVEERNTIRVLPTISSKIIVSANFMGFGIVIVFLLPPKERTLPEFGGENKVFFFSSTFFPSIFLFHLGQKERKHFVKPCCSLQYTWVF